MKLTKKEKSILDTAKEAMKPEEIMSTISNVAELKQRQETPDPPEALKSIPMLKLSDIPEEITKIPTDEQQEKGTTILSHDLFTNDVLYLETALELRTLPANLLPLVPLFCRCLTEMGTSDLSFVELVELIDRKTGGVSVSQFVSNVKGQDEAIGHIMVKGKAMKDKIGEMMDIMKKILLTARFDDQQRFKQMVLESKSGLESGIVSSGHRFARRRLAAQRSHADWVLEITGGLSYLEFIRNLADRVDSDWNDIQQDLETIRSYLINRNGAVVNVTGDEDTLLTAKPYISQFLDALPNHVRDKADWSSMLPLANEALVVPTQVNYVGKAVNLYKDAGFEFSGSANVVEKFLYTSWLWDRVRVMGGAYGAMAGLDYHSGIFAFSSYRDPNLVETLSNYDGSCTFLKDLKLNDDELSKAIIGTIGDVDAYQLPDAKGHTALLRYLLGVTDAERQERRDQILSTSVKDFNTFGEFLEAIKGEKARVVAVTSQDGVKAMAEKNPNFWEVRKVL